MKASFPFDDDDDGLVFMMKRVTRGEDELRKRRCGSERSLASMLRWKWKPIFCSDG